MLHAMLSTIMELQPLIIVWLSIYSEICGAMECQNYISQTITVGTSGFEEFKTVQGAIDSIPPNKDSWTKIHINPAVYNERVHIPVAKTCIFLEGSGRGVTTIVGNAHEVTDQSATFFSLAENLLAAGITFQNSYNRPLAQDEEIGPAVAARIYGDKSAFYECGFVGLQDTIWDGIGRHYFNNCYIEGAVDFIFGSGQSFYEDCWINATSGRLPSYAYAGFITAQGRASPNDTSGYVFNRGTVFGSGQSYLGRAYGPYSRVIFLETTLDAQITPQGWDPWWFAGKEGNFTYAEVNCKGSGSDTSKRVPWTKKLTQDEINQFSRSSFIDQDGWLAKLPPLMD